MTDMSVSFPFIRLSVYHDQNSGSVDADDQSVIGHGTNQEQKRISGSIVECLLRPVNLSLRSCYIFSCSDASACFGRLMLTFVFFRMSGVCPAIDIFR